MNKLIACVALCAGSLWIGAQTSGEGTGIRGFQGPAARAQRALEDKARAIPEPSRLRDYMKRMSAEPHIAGTPESKAVADYAAGLMRSWGLDTHVEVFEALLPFPTERRLEMTAPVRYRARLEEPKLPQDAASLSERQIPTYNAYAATGDVTAPLVYVNYGIPEDYDELARLGVDVKGKIVIARYGRSWRGTKPKVAQERGALGCLIYSDPRDDGYFQGDAYPRGPFRPPHGVQRGSVMDMPLYVGDPLSPGWASEKGTKRLNREEAATVLRIPVLPISYEDARPLMANLDGPVAPEAWRGALPVTYHIGAGPAVVRLKVDFDWTSKPLYNVVATVPGRETPDEWVVYGNHHDAWNNGAGDPVSGASVVLETARTLGALRKSGWQPKRTIKLALWDGEEFGLVGSTEWVEKHRDELMRKAIAYLNTDMTGKGTAGASGSPALEAFFRQVLRDVQHPNGKGSVLQNRPVANNKPVPFRMGPAGAGSDYVAFLHHAGIASINTGFSGESSGGIYHSVYDSFDWYTKFSDSDFTHGRALAQVMTTALLRLTEAQVLPFEFRNVARAVEAWAADLPKADLTALQAELKRLQSTAEAYEERFGRQRNPSAELNAALIRTERALLDPDGLTGRQWYKHQLMAPGRYTGYSAKTLPAIRDSDDPQAGVARVAAALRRYSEAVEEATRLLTQ